MIGNRSGHKALMGTQPGSGFTLMEILVVMMIFGIVFLTIYSAWAAVVKTSRTVSIDAIQYEAAEACLNRIIDDLQSLYVIQRPQYSPPGAGEDPDPYRFRAENEPTAFPILQFGSLGHLGLRRGAMNASARIAYYLESSSGQAPFVIRRSDRLFPADPLEKDPADPILCENVLELAFLFFDPDGTGHDNWDSDDETFDYATPAAVAIHLVIGAAQRPIAFDTTVVLPVTREPQGVL